MWGAWTLVTAVSHGGGGGDLGLGDWPGSSSYRYRFYSSEQSLCLPGRQPPQRVGLGPLTAWTTLVRIDIPGSQPRPRVLGARPGMLSR